MKLLKSTVFLLMVMLAEPLMAYDQVQTDKGMVEGKRSADSKIHIFLGIPYAAPPVGELRWKAPQPAPSWKGIKKATQFGHRPMQGHIWDDMIFYDPGPSEDCLTLNVWTPAVNPKEKLPVMVWVYGGGFIAGGTSEKRQEGENLARKGVVVVTFNYRLGVFGFLAHPELGKESGRGASGNYGLMDQVAALQWVRKNIAVFGGDPNNVTIFGESAGSFSVSALMAMPWAQGLFQRVIGESGALFGAKRAPKPVEQAEEEGVQFAKSVGAKSLKDLRAMSAEELLNAAWKGDQFRFGAVDDGFYLPGVEDIYAVGQQSLVPLLAGWNADEGGYRWVLKDGLTTQENYVKLAGEQFGDKADDFLKLYPAQTADEIKRAAGDLAGDQFIAYSTWKWIEAHSATAKKPVYRYEFDQAPPTNGQEESRGVYHSAEIEFVFGALASKKLPWRPEDWKVSDLMMNYWSNFAKKGDPNGPGLPKWPLYKAGSHYQVMHLSADPKALPDMHRKRYQFLEKMDSKKH